MTPQSHLRNSGSFPNGRYGYYAIPHEHSTLWAARPVLVNPHWLSNWLRWRPQAGELSIYRYSPEFNTNPSSNSATVKPRSPRARTFLAPFLWSAW